MDEFPLVPSSTAESTVVQVPLTQHLMVGGVFVVVGVGIGLAAPFVVDWALAQSWLPFKGPMMVVDQLSGRFGLWLLIVLGGLAGLVLGFLAAADETKVEIGARDITLVKGSTRERFARSQVGSAVLDGNHLTLRDAADADLIRRKLDLPMDAVAQALSRFEWPTERVATLLIGF